MSSVNLTIDHDELAFANSDVSDSAPYTVSAWFIDKADGTLVCAERSGINPVNLIGEVLTDLSRQCDALLEVR